jgi:hypothetical protein
LNEKIRTSFPTFPRQQRFRENLEWIKKFEWPRFETWQENISSVVKIVFYCCFWNFLYLLLQILQPTLRDLIKLTNNLFNLMCEKSRYVFLCTLPNRDFLEKFRKFLKNKLQSKPQVYFLVSFEPTSHQNLIRWKEMHSWTQQFVWSIHKI